MAFYNFISNITNWFWGIPVVLILIGGGFFLTIKIRGIQFRKFGVIWKKTFGSLFDKEAQKKRLETTGVTPLAAAWSALGCTIGTGNIVGAATAIALGGPGALFWMWLSALAAMAVKYGEAVLSIRYREKRVDGYFGGLYMYIKNGLNNKALAGITAVIMLVAGTIVAGSHGASIKGSFVQMGMPSISAVVVCGIFVLAVLIFGTRGLNKITGIMIPFMTAFYLVLSIVVVFANIGNIGPVIVSIFKGAFCGQAAIAGFGGAALAQTVRWGLARGVFSNDAGLGFQAVLYAEAEDNKDPAETGCWAIAETFIDTIVVCSLTCFMVLLSGVWQTGASGLELASAAISTVFGEFGRIGCLISMILFALSSQIGICNVVRRQSIALTGKKAAGYIAGAIFFVVVIAACMFDIEQAFVFADFGNGIILTLNVIAIILLSKELRSAVDGWLERPEVSRKAK